MRHHKIGARAEYRQQESQRIRDSVSLSNKFPDLKSLTVDLTYYGSERFTPSGQIKYTVNLTNAKSVFRFDCLNNECVGGDFDLSAELTTAVAAHRVTASGEKCCQGWRSKNTIDSVHCHNILRYQISLEY
jgi:hypothetical protein